MKPLFLNPHWLVENNMVPKPGVYIVFAVPYSHHGKPIRQWSHKTLSGAARRMGSIIRGKLQDRSDQAVFALAPDGTIHNRNSAKGF